MRKGELIALRASDVDFERKLIHVQRAFSRGLFNNPKSGKPRFVEMSRQLTAVLRELNRSGDQLLFPSATGTLYGQSNLCRDFKQLLAHLKITLKKALTNNEVH